MDRNNDTEYDTHIHTKKMYPDKQFLKHKSLSSVVFLPLLPFWVHFEAKKFPF
jgi:hypothetical protein